jgi:asparagine synthase (glutamine-hydrolysing)
VSAIFGFAHFDDRPAESGLIEQMRAASAHRGPDGSTVWMDGPAGLGHQRLSSTPESLRECQPLEDGRFVLAFDGRIDNRESLREALRGRLRADTDAEIVLRSYEAWGDGAPEKLVGDFAFAVWDRRERTLFAARDFLGFRPFYYHHAASAFFFATEPATLLATDQVARTLNEGMIGEFLAGAITHREETLYAAIRRLPPGHFLRATTHGVRLTRYFSLGPRPPIRYRRDEEYQEHFRSLLTEATRARRRSAGPIGIYLSGGLDSTSVVATAAPMGPITAYSIGFPGRACDETSRIDEVRRRWDVPGETIAEPRPEIDYYQNESERTLNFPGYPNGAVLSPCASRARRDGVRVLFTGFGGNEWWMGTPPPRIAFSLWLRRVLRSRDSRLSWIEPGFAKRIDLPDRLRPRSQLDSLPPALRTLSATFECGAHVHAIEMQDQAASRDGVEFRHPLSDRRLVEFALAIPDGQRRRGRIRKFILRETMRGLLPDSVRLGVADPDFSHLFGETLRLPEARARLESARVAGRRWATARKIRESSSEATRRYESGDPTYGALVWPLWMALGLDFFLGVSRTRPEAIYA